VKPGQVPIAFDLLHIEAFVWNRKMSRVDVTTTDVMLDEREVLAL
jgi:hypothetical protein